MNFFQKYIKKPEIVKAIQWFKNGDHPNDNCFEIVSSNNELFLSEGEIVRYYRNPNFPGEMACKKCNKKYDDHGWIEKLTSCKEGLTVCPGDYVVTRNDNIYCVFKPEDFEENFDKYE